MKLQSLFLLPNECRASNSPSTDANMACTRVTHQHGQVSSSRIGRTFRQFLRSTASRPRATPPVLLMLLNMRAHNGTAILASAKAQTATRQGLCQLKRPQSRRKRVVRKRALFNPSKQRVVAATRCLVGDLAQAGDDGNPVGAEHAAHSGVQAKPCLGPNAKSTSPLAIPDRRTDCSLHETVGPEVAMCCQNK